MKTFVAPLLFVVAILSSAAHAAVILVDNEIPINSAITGNSNLWVSDTAFLDDEQNTLTFMVGAGFQTPVLLENIGTLAADLGTQITASTGHTAEQRDAWDVYGMMLDAFGAGIVESYNGEDEGDDYSYYLSSEIFPSEQEKLYSWLLSPTNDPGLHYMSADLSNYADIGYDYGLTMFMPVEFDNYPLTDQTTNKLAFAFTIDAAEATPEEPYGVPEPATMAMFAIGLAGVGFTRRRKLQS